MYKSIRWQRKKGKLQQMDKGDSLVKHNTSVYAIQLNQSIYMYRVRKDIHLEV